MAIQDTSHYSSQKSITVETKDETQKKIIRKRLDGRRGSSISADHVAAATELAQNQQYMKNDLIHEETEGQTSSDDQRQHSPNKLRGKHDLHRRKSQIVSP